MSFSERISPLIGRWVLAWFFLSAAWDRTHDWHGTIQQMVHHHIPLPEALLTLAMIVMVMGGLAFLLGYQTRHAAILLFGFTIAVTVLIHNFWDLHSAARTADYEIFARNIAVAGGLLLLVGMGPGPFAFDNRAGKKKGR